jgi:hypothetical protein
VVVGSVADVSELYTTSIFIVKVSRFLFQQNCGGKGVGSCLFQVMGAADKEKLVVKWPFCRAMESPRNLQMVVFP